MKILAGMTTNRTQITSAGAGQYKELEALVKKAIKILSRMVQRTIFEKGYGDFITRVTYDNNRLIASLDHYYKSVEEFGVAPELVVGVKTNGILQVNARILDTANSQVIFFKRIGELNYSGVDPHDIYLDIYLNLLDHLFWCANPKQSDLDANNVVYLFYKNTLFRTLKKYSTDPSVLGDRLTDRRLKVR